MKKIEFNNSQMGLLAKAFFENLFPRPNFADIFVKEKKLSSFFYFTDEYYNELVNFINQDYIINSFKKSNAYYEWINLKDQFENYVNVNNRPLDSFSYPLIQDSENKAFYHEKKELYLKEIELKNIHISYNNALEDIKNLYQETKKLYINSVLRSICKENNVVIFFTKTNDSSYKYLGVVKINNSFYLVDKNNDYHDIVYDDKLLSIISLIINI